MSTERRGALLGAKASALVKRHLADRGDPVPDDLSVHGSPLGAGVVVGDEGWFLADDRPARSLGRALAWARAQGVDRLTVMADESGDVLARRAAPFAPPPAVYAVDDDSLSVAEPAAHPDEPLPPESAGDQVALLHEVGLDVVTEHGVVTGEVEGLEIARVIVEDDGATRLEVGVGRHDREAFAMVHGDRPTVEALHDVASTVRSHRRVGAPSHPLGRLASARWLRALVVADPSVVGASALRPVSPAVPRDNVKDAVPATAVGEDADGGAVVVTCSVGLDLDVVPEGADLRARHAPDARLVVVVPERDRHPLLEATAAALAEPAEVVTVPTEWRNGLAQRRGA